MSYGSTFGTSSIDNSLAADAQSLGQLKLQAGNNSAAATKETAKQFESMFMKELLKSMRDANAAMKSGEMYAFAGAIAVTTESSPGDGTALSPVSHLIVPVGGHPDCRTLPGPALSGSAVVIEKFSASLTWQTEKGNETVLPLHGCVPV